MRLPCRSCERNAAGYALPAREDLTLFLRIHDFLVQPSPRAAKKTLIIHAAHYGIEQKSGRSPICNAMVKRKTKDTSMTDGLLHR